MVFSLADRFHDSSIESQNQLYQFVDSISRAGYSAIPSPATEKLIGHAA
jgi:hypothetical protein